MNETIKTSIFAILAVVLSVAAYATLPKALHDPGKNINDPVFPKFTDITEVDQVEIVQHDRSKSKIDRLKIALRKGKWVIESHGNYPASDIDVEERISIVLSSLMDMKVLGTATSLVEEHQLYGALEPDEKNVEQGTKKLGMKIGVFRRDGSKLAELIVGNRVEGHRGQRFVRKPGNNTIYAVRFDARRFSTIFQQWVDDDALETKENKIVKMGLRRYTSTTGQLDRHFDIAVKRNADNENWGLDFYTQYVQGKGVSSQLKDAERLHAKNFEAIHDLLQRLQIIDVESKSRTVTHPASTAEEAFDVRTLYESLPKHGFYPAQGLEVTAQKGFSDIAAAEGEAHLVTDDGVRYILKFGTGTDLLEVDGRSTIPRYLLISAELHDETLQAIRLKSLEEGAKEEEKKDFQEIRQQAVEKVESLNQRFDRHYFVIPEATYHQLHLGLSDCIQYNADEKNLFGVDVFRKLEAEGLTKPTPKQ